MSKDEKNEYELIIRKKHQAKEMNYEHPEPEDNLYKRAVTGIKNAWNKSAIVDNRGKVWVSVNKLHTILRTSKGDARYLIARISDKYKVEIDGDKFVKGSKIYGLIDELIQNAGRIKREKYLKFSESFYRNIRDADKSRLLRCEFDEFIDNLKKRLKGKRIKKYNINVDELTGESLYKRSSDFSHIRKANLYPRLAGEVENGLVVNKNTHKIITHNEIKDENDLIDLCAQKGWNTNWYEKYLNYFNFK